MLPSGQVQAGERGPLRQERPRAPLEQRQSLPERGAERREPRHPGVGGAGGIELAGRDRRRGARAGERHREGLERRVAARREREQRALRRRRECGRHAAAAGGQQAQRSEAAGEAQEAAPVESGERPLGVTRGRAHAARAPAAAPSAMRSALAMIVTCGLAPVLLGSEEASLT